MTRIILSIVTVIIYLALSVFIIIMSFDVGFFLNLLFIAVSIGFWYLIRYIHKDVPTKKFIIHFVLHTIGGIALMTADFFMFLFYLEGDMQASCEGGPNPYGYLSFVGPIINILYFVGIMVFYKMKEKK